MADGSLPLIAVVGQSPTQEAVDMLAGLAVYRTFDTREELLSSGVKPYALLFGHAPAFREDLLAKLPSVRLVVALCVGTNHIDIQPAGRMGIAVCNLPAYGTEEVADAAVTHLLNLYRRTQEVLLDRHSKSLPPSTPREIGAYSKGVTRMRGQKLGLIGCGPIGLAVVLRAKPFGFDISFYDPYLPHGMEKAMGVRRHENLDDLLAESDCLSLHCPLTKTTHHMVGEDAFSKVKPGVRIVNTGRGGVIDEEALAKALKDGRVFSAALDVQEKEPFVWSESPLYDCPNVQCTPHVAWYSDQSLEEIWRLGATEAKRALLNRKSDNPQPLPKCLFSCVNAKFWEQPSES